MKADRVGSGWVLLGGMLLLGAGAARGDWPAPPADIQKLVIPVDKSDSAAEVVRMDMGTALVGPQPWRPKEAPQPEPQVATKDKGYVLSGDLFGTGGFFALYEPKIGTKPGTPTLALAEFEGNGWKLRGLWKFEINWIPQDKRWSGPEHQFEQSDSLHLPFLLEDVIGDNVPEVIVAGEKSKYNQARYVMKYNKQSHGLDLLTYSWAMPAKADKYLRIYHSSGGKAIWSEWTFLEWKDEKLVERAMWHSESPYNNVDPPFFLIRTTHENGKVENFRATRNASGEEPWSFDVLKGGKPFTTLTTQWLSEKRPPNEDLVEGAWIFEKLTGLSRGIFPERHGPLDQDKSKLEPLENFATMKVSGTDEARRRFAENK